MKVFVTGGTGFIGTILTDRLVQDGHTVTMLVRNPELVSTIHNERIILVKGDLSNKEAIMYGMKDCDWVFHLAASAKPWYKDSEEADRTIVKGSENIFESALKCRVKRVVFTSTAGTMGHSKDKNPVDERTNSNPEYYTQYERSKALAEKKAISYCEKGLDIVIVNPTRVYGPGKLTESNSVTKIIKLYTRGLWRIVPGSGNSIGNYVFVYDVIQGHLLAAIRGKKGERYILGGENHSLRELLLIIDRITGKDRMVFPVPESMLKAVINLAVFSSKMTGTTPLITTDWLKKYMDNWIMSSEKAVRELGYKITPFSEGALHTIEWLKSR